jgi:hypothetical protein
MEKKQADDMIKVLKDISESLKEIVKIKKSQQREAKKTTD